MKNVTLGDMITITLPREKLLGYIRDSMIYDALKASGVDNWERYGENSDKELRWYINDMNLDPDSDFCDVASAIIDESVKSSNKEQTGINTWISVSDRLPTDRRDYLLTDGEHCYVGHYRPDAKAWDHWIIGWVQHCCADGNVEDVNITHWMPLPELPTEFSEVAK